MSKQSHPQLRKALSLAANFNTREAIRLAIWELMKCQTQVNKMDKEIKKIQKDVKKKDMPKAKKDLSSLLKKDKAQDKKIAKCAMKKKGKK